MNARPPGRSDEGFVPFRVFVGVGSNIEPNKNVRRALSLLAKRSDLRVVGISTFFRTPALPGPEAPDGQREDHPDYLNGVLELRTALDPGSLSDVLEEVERALGRVRGPDKYAPRTMDLDLLLYLPPPSMDVPPLRDGAALLPSSTPASFTGPDGTSHEWPAPHKEIRTRAFVAVPLFELVPDLLLPPDRKPLAELAAAFPGPGGIPEPDLTRELRSAFLAG